MPLRGEDNQEALASANEALAAFVPRFEVAHLSSLRRKLGLLTERKGDTTLAGDLLGPMAAKRRGLHPDLAPPVRRGRDTAGGRRRAAGIVHGRGRLRRLGRALAPAAHGGAQ